MTTTASEQTKSDHDWLDDDHELDQKNTKNVLMAAKLTNLHQQPVLETNANDHLDLLPSRNGSISSGDSCGSHNATDKSSAFATSSADTLSSTSQESTSCGGGSGSGTTMNAVHSAGSRTTSSNSLVAGFIGPLNVIGATATAGDMLDPVSPGAQRRLTKYQKNERAVHGSPRCFTPKRKQNRTIPAPLALVAAATNVVLGSGESATATAAPLATFTPPDTPTSEATSHAVVRPKESTASISDRLSSGIMGRFRLPPPLRMIKKKHSCPHLFGSGGPPNIGSLTTVAYNNAATSSGQQSPCRTPVLSEAKNCAWIRNEFGSTTALNPPSYAARARLCDDSGVVFRFDHLTATASAAGVGGSSSGVPPVNKSHSYHQLLHQQAFNLTSTIAPPHTAAAVVASVATTAGGGGAGAAGIRPATRYRLIKESPPVQLCKLDHPRTVVGKLASSKLLRRWETHTVVLDGERIRSTTPSGFMETVIPYSTIEDIQMVPHFEGAGKYCLRIFIPDGSILLQTNHHYARQQWLLSIHWRRCMFRFRKILQSCSRPEVLLKEIKCMVEMAKESPLQDETIFLVPVQLVCGVIKQIFDGKLCRTLLDPIIITVSPLLETICSVSEICPWFNRYCRESPRSRLVDDIFSNVALQTLKKNMDFGKFPAARSFIQNFLLAVIAQNNGVDRVKQFVQRAHGPASVCPHPRVLPNLISACLAAIHSIFDPTVPPSPIGLAPSMESLSLSDLALNPVDADMLVDDLVDDAIIPPSADVGNSGFTPAEIMDRRRLFCYCVIFEAVSEFEDWRASLSSIVQPLPFPDEAFTHDVFTRAFHKVVQRIGVDPRCEVHLGVLGVREGKEGFFHLYCPGGPSCVDDGELYANMLNTLLKCCCKRKRFLQSLTTMLGPLQLLALRENSAAMQALCYMLELEVVDGDDTKVQMITALQSTSAGRRFYVDLCDRQHALRELQQKGGPRKLTLPSKSTDADLAVLLSSGSFGNLEWLSLAFTNVTSACAEYLIKLPSLRYLNLWSTQFGDLGVQLVAEHLHRLQVLNLCETRVTDKGLLTLTSLKNLRKLNLNSTQLSAKTFQTLREKLPALQEVDIRYTEAWCAEDYPTPGQTSPQRR